MFSIGDSLNITQNHRTRQGSRTLVPEIATELTVLVVELTFMVKAEVAGTMLASGGL